MSLGAITPVRRALTETERRLIRARIRSLRARGRRAPKRALASGAGVIFVLWLWTLLASDAPWLVVTACWLVVGGGIMLWARKDMRRDVRHMEDQARNLESALRRNAADDYDVRARAFAEFEEVEDEGACYAFELGDGRLVFVQGQEFYESAKFPSLDFSLVDVLDEAGRTVETLIDKRGAKAAPAKTIPAAVKQRLGVPDHLEVRAGRIDDLAAILGDRIWPR